MASNKFIIYFLYLPIEHTHGYPKQAFLDQLPFCACVQGGGGDSHTPCDHDFVINRKKIRKDKRVDLSSKVSGESYSTHPKDICLQIAHFSVFK